MTETITHKDMHRVVMVCLIHNEKREYLIIKRSPKLKVYPGKWTIPGGGLETDDYVHTPQTSPDGWEHVVSTALRREISEEVAVEVGEFLYQGSVAFIRPDNVPVVVLRFTAPYVRGEVVLDPEDSTEYAWVTAGKAKNYDLLGNILAEIEQFDKRLKDDEDT